jgi:uncharacterized caspase-like protein
MRSIITLLICLLPSAAIAQTKIALLIGNQGYDASVGILKNSHNDIAIVAEALRAQNFDVLPLMKDARRSVMLGGVRELVRRLNMAETGSIGLIYYSGHGAAEKDTNTNYLIPVDAKGPGTTVFWDQSLKLDHILSLLEGARSAAKFVVFDACRNELQLPTKDTSKGLVPITEQQGIFIAYATSPGRTALDRGDKSGPYAAAFAAELLRPGLDHLNLFQNVKETVLASTAGVQQPWESNGLSRRVYLTEQPKLDPALVPRVSEAIEVWDRTKDTKETAVLEAFAARYRDTIFAELARARIEALQMKSALLLGADISDQDRKRVAALASAKKLPLPAFKMVRPTSDTPRDLTKFVGIWMSEAGFVGSGRQFMLIVTKADESGIRGFASWGPGKRGSLAPYEPRSIPVSGSVSNGELTIGAAGDPSLVATFVSGTRLKVIVQNTFKSRVDVRKIWQFPQ